MPSLVYATETGSYEDFVGVCIANRLLDDGCDPSVVSGALNVLHGLFGYRGHDGAIEAPMQRRLIEGGADVNLVSKRWGPPLVMVIQNGPWPEVEMVPFYEEFFRRPDLDLSVPSSHTDKSLREFIFASPPFSLLHDFVRAYDRERRNSN